MKKYTSTVKGNSITTTSVKIVCDRCGCEFDANHKYIFKGPKRDGVLTGICLVANKRYHLPIKDLCDTCLEEILGDIYDDKHGVWLNLGEDNIEEDTDE